MACEPGCRECCQNYAPGMTKLEWLAVNHPGKFASGRGIQGCPFLAAEGCAIYRRRPLICRLFGTVSQVELAELKLAEALTLACPRGCLPEKPLGAGRALKLLLDWQHQVREDLRRMILDWLKYVEFRPDNAPIPEKFEWLRYILSTRDGRQTLGMGLLRVEPGLALGQDKMTAIEHLLGEVSHG